MMHRLAICLAIASLTFVAPRPAEAAVTHVFDAVDAVELESGSPSRLIVTGILAGGTAQTTLAFTISGTDMAIRCERLAVIAMSKPGKFQFAVGSNSLGGCKLIRITP